MKLEAKREHLLKPLQHVIGAVERRQTLPILTNVLLTATERELWQHIRDEHAAHLAALGWQGDLAAATPASATPAALRQAERRATRGRAQAARSEPDAQRAQVLALIAASEAQHAVALS